MNTPVQGRDNAARRDDIRTRAAQGIAAYSPEGAAAVVREATGRAHGAVPSLLVLTAIALEHGCAAAGNIPDGFSLDV